MAPELLVKEMLISVASIIDLFLADVWVLGMIFFSMINPSLNPFVQRSDQREALLLKMT